MLSRGALVARIAVLAAACAVLLAAPGQAAPSSMVALGIGANANSIFKFAGDKPGLTASLPVTGLGASTLVGLDYRPATGELYALGVNSNTAALFTIDPTSGVATPVGSATVNSIAGATSYGIDFNPVSDRLRVVNNLATDGGGGNANNFRLTPSGALAGVDTDGNFTGLPGGNANAPNVAVAYDRNVAGAAASTLFGILSGGDRLVIQGGVNGSPSPNLGILSNVGLLGVDTSNNAGFDIDPASGEAYAVLEVGGVSGLYRVNLSTGAATLIGSVGNGAVDFGGLSIAPPPAPVQPPIPPAPPEPKLESLQASPSTFAAANIGGAILSRVKRKAPVGTTVSYDLSVAATVSFTVERRIKGRKVGKKCRKRTRANRRRKPCTLIKAVKGSFSHPGAAGQNRF